MDWRAVKFDWNRARAFLVTAEEGSLSGAARALGMAQPTLGRQVSALEDELGVLLFERAGRGIALTASGLELLDHVRTMGEAAGRVSLAAGGQAQSIEGTICITASEIYSAFMLPPIIQKIRQVAPGIDIEIVASNDTVDLRRREADIAVRSFRPTQPDLIAKKIKDENGRLYASHDYLEKIGQPATIDEVSAADFIGFENIEQMIHGLKSIGVELTRNSFPIVTSNHMVHWSLAKQGVGIGIFPEAIGASSPLVREVLPGMPPFVLPIWLTTHRELNTSRRVRLVFDLMAAEIAHWGEPSYLLSDHG
jgi:DNA-binding transcriptional LysR family regulator